MSTSPAQSSLTSGPIIVSGEDLSTGLVGQQVDGIYGYTPACATEIVRRIVLNVTAAGK